MKNFITSLQDFDIFSSIRKYSDGMSFTPSCKLFSKFRVKEHLTKTILKYKASVILLLMILTIINPTYGAAPQAITQVGTTYSSYVTGTGDLTLTLNKPTGVIPGDIMIVTIVKTNLGTNIAPPTTPTGWNLIDSARLYRTLTPVGAVFYRVVDGTEGASFAFPMPGNTKVTHAEGALIAYTGVSIASPFDVSPGLITISDDGDKPKFLDEITGITTVTPGALVLMLGMTSSSGGGAPAPRIFSTWSVAISPGLTEVYDVQGTSYVSVGAASGIQATPGATGDGEFTYIGTDGKPHDANPGGIILALRPKMMNYWIGSQSTVWSNPLNWLSQSVPLTGEDVEFGTVLNCGTPAVNDLIMDNDYVIGGYTNATNFKLIIPTSRTLTVNGVVNTNSTDRILIQSAADVTNGSLIFTYPSFNKDVPASVQMYSKAYRDPNGTTVTAPDGSTYTVYYKWQYFTIPVQSAVYNSTFTSAAPVSYVRVSNESKNNDLIYYNEWDQLSNEATLSPFTGYEITQLTPKTITFKGALVTSDKTLSLTYTPNTISGSPGSGSNIFGNSFTAAIDINKIVFPETNVDKTVYLYNTGSLNDWFINSDHTVNLESTVPGSYVAIPKVVSPVIQPEIPSMQGFMLIATAAATVTIPYSAVLKNSIAQRIKPEDAGGFSYLTADVAGKTGADRVWLFSQPETSHAYDNGWDGRKIRSGGLTLYVDENEEKLQVSTSDNLDETYLALKAGSDTEYTLRINKTHLTGYNTLYLTDLETNTVTDLSVLDEFNYTFTATNTTNAVRRFQFTSKDKTKNKSAKEPKVKIFNSGNILRIDNSTNERGTVQLYDMMGQLRQTSVMNAASVTEIITSVSPSVYVVRVQATGIEQCGKIVIRH